MQLLTAPYQILTEITSIPTMSIAYFSYAYN